MVFTFLKVNLGARPAFSTGWEFPLGASTWIIITMMTRMMMLMAMMMTMMTTIRMMTMMMMTLVHLRQEDSGSRAQLTKLCKRKRNLLFLESSFFNYEKESVFTIVLPPQLVGVGGDDAVNDVGCYEDWSWWGYRWQWWQLIMMTIDNDVNW